MNCREVGDANPDIAGIGIVVSFIIQASLAVVMSYYSFILNGNTSDTTVKPTKRNKLKPEPWQIKQATVNRILLQGSDLQSITGIALLVSALVQIDSLPFYHLHIVYDTVSLVAVSYAAAIVCSFKISSKRKIQRYSLILLWSILYIVYTSLFGVRLKGRSWNIGGHCYNLQKISFPTASHPHVDNIYISLTCLYVFGSLGWASGIVNLYLCATLIVFGFEERRFSKYFSKYSGRATEAFVLGVAALQLPVHLYSLLALRASNEKFLNSGTTEQEWGFGQIVAMIPLGSNVLGVLSGVQDYHEWKKSVAKHRAEERNGAAAQKLTTGQAQVV